MKHMGVDLTGSACVVRGTENSAGRENLPLHSHAELDSEWYAVPGVSSPRGLGLGLGLERESVVAKAWQEESGDLRSRSVSATSEVLGPRSPPL